MQLEALKLLDAAFEIIDICISILMSKESLMVNDRMGNLYSII